MIIGGGMTGAAAASGIREIDPKGSIAIKSAEPHAPYNRPPLSKGLWKGKPFETIFRREVDNGVELHLNCRVISLDAARKQVIDESGQVHTYGKLLLATGGRPRRLPFGDGRIMYYRTLDDYQRLRKLVDEGGHYAVRRFAVIGGGFIGSEIAAAIAQKGRKVSMVFPEAGIGARLFPANLSRFLNDYYRERGIDVLEGELVSSLDNSHDGQVLKTKSGKEILADVIVAGIGLLPNTGLAEAAGIETKDGILVDEHLRTNQPDIFAAGDVARFYNPLLDNRLRVEHADNANTMGRIAGQNMAGESLPYHHLPFFYSDMFDTGYEAVGEINSELETFSDWQEPFQKGVIYYLDRGRLRGVLLWNIFDQIEAARQLISEPGPFKEGDLRDRLPAP
jgi:NADPH-dependent 2,4-dienoyl-CoA reductase/sulfur reductase-like enzyme